MLDQIISFFSADIRLAAPLLFAALGLLLHDRAGVSNIGAEGMILMGALFSVLGSYLTGSAWAGLLFGGIAGALSALIFSFLVVTLHADATVTGAALNILCAGITTTLYRMIFGVQTGVPPINSFNTLEIPALSKIPVLGPILFQQNILTYFLPFLLIGIHILLSRTELGLQIRAVGENPRACDTVGISVNRIKYGTLLFGGLMCGIAGCYLSLGSLSFFTEDMVSGRGFIALAAVVFGKWKPMGILCAALLFGAGSALQLRIQAAGAPIPSQFLMMLPYLLTILALCGVVGKSEPPAASGLDYVKE